MKRGKIWGLLLAGSLALPLLAGTPGDRPLLHGLFSSNMVLQRDKPVPIWGWAEPGTEVVVEFAGQRRSAVAAAPDGRWQVELAPLAVNAEGAVLTVSAGALRRELTNVVVGDVWLAGGQSNMELGIMSTNQWWNQVGTHPGLRLYLNPVGFSPEPRDGAAGRWEVCTPESLNNKVNPFGGFSAIAYFFGRAIQQATGVPIGMIQSCIGNTDIDTWIKPEALRDERGGLGPREEFGRKVEAEFAKGDPAYAETSAWHEPGFDDSAWPGVTLPRLWRGDPASGGLIWLRRTVEVPAAWSKGMILVNLGPISYHDTLWANGVFIGAVGHHQRQRRYEIPGSLVRDGKLQLTLRVQLDAGFTGRPEDLWLLGENADPASRIALSGDWKYHLSTPKGKFKVRILPDCWMYGSGYNGMIRALAPFALKGFIWYQGCGNVGNNRNYLEKFKAMIEDWRALFRAPEAPFYCVQLAGFGRYQPEPASGSGWAEIRRTQAAIADELPNTGFAVAIDRGDQLDIHPQHKWEVGERLAKVALARDYGKEVEYRGPQLKSLVREEKTLRLTFDYAEGLHSLGGAPVGFAVAGADGRYHWAHARIEGADVVLWSEEVPEPVAASYAWADNSLANCYNRAGLPMVPFRQRLP